MEWDPAGKGATEAVSAAVSIPQDPCGEQACTKKSLWLKPDVDHTNVYSIPTSTVQVTRRALEPHEILTDGCILPAI